MAERASVVKLIHCSQSDTPASLDGLGEGEGQHLLTLQDAS